MTQQSSKVPKPCSACPWMSRDERDVQVVNSPDVQAAMKEGRWFCCHVNMGTCHGARIRHQQHQRKTEGAST